jgi:hypothetical protein
MQGILRGAKGLRIYFREPKIGLENEIETVSPSYPAAT